MKLGTTEGPLEGRLPKGTEENHEKSQDIGCSDRHSNWSSFDFTAQTLPDGRTFWVPRIVTELKNGLCKCCFYFCHIMSDIWVKVRPGSVASLWLFRIIIYI